MSLKKSKTINVNGSSVVTVDEKETVVMTMNASLQEGGAVSINKYIQDKDLYLEKKDTVEADCKEFEAYVDSMMEV